MGEVIFGVFYVNFLRVVVLLFMCVELIEFFYLFIFKIIYIL